MYRSQSAAALLAALLFVGCGQSNSPSPAAKPPVSQTPPALPEANPPAQATDQDAANPATDTEPAAQESSLTSGKAPDDGAAAEETMPAVEEATPQSKAPSDEPAETTSAATDQDSTPARPRSNRPTRRLLRGLASSLTRAVSKAASANAQNNEQSAGDDKPRPAPDLGDDPFPNGEPADNKPAEKSSETKPGE